MKRPTAKKRDNRPIVWEATPRQAEVLSAPEREVLYGGSLGGGKTDCGLAVCLAQIGNAKHRALFLRKSFPELRSAIERSHELYRPCGGQFNVQNSTWSFPSGARIEFGFLDSETDRFRYLGRSWNTIFWDELCQWPTSLSYLYLLTRLRTTVDSGLRLECRASANPLGVGANWVRARWAIPDDGGPSRCVDETTGFHRRFIPARIEDNPYLLGSDYVRQLEALPSEQRAALKDGRWDSVSGAIFSEFSAEKHLCEPFAVPSAWGRRWRGGDWGYRAPFCSLWLLHDTDRDDCIYVIGEIYRSGSTADEAAASILAMDKELTGERWSGAMDSSAWANVGAGDGTPGEVMNRLGCNWRPASKGAGSIAVGLQAIHSRLRVREDGSVGLKIFRGRCPNLEREIRGLVYDETHAEEYDRGCADHAIASLRYGLLDQPSRSGRANVYF